MRTKEWNILFSAWASGRIKKLSSWLGNLERSRFGGSSSEGGINFDLPVRYQNGDVDNRMYMEVWISEERLMLGIQS